MPGSGTSATDAAATASAVGALRTRVLGFVESQRLAALGPGRYRYSASVRQPTLYSSSYAAMTRDLLGVANGVIGWMLKRYPDIGISDDTLTPVVAECDDSRLNDSRGPDPRLGTAEGGLVPGGLVPQDPAVHLVGVGIEVGRGVEAPAVEGPGVVPGAIRPSVRSASTPAQLWGSAKAPRVS